MRINKGFTMDCDFSLRMLLISSFWAESRGNRRENRKGSGRDATVIYSRHDFDSCLRYSICVENHRLFLLPSPFKEYIVVEYGHSGEK